MTALILMTGCNSGSPYTLQERDSDCNSAFMKGAPGDVTVTPAQCHFNLEPLTAIQFGDSISLAYSGYARLRLYGVVDFRHDPWQDGDIPVHDDPYFFGQVGLHGDNNGFSTTLLEAMRRRLGGQHYNVISFNSGLHDLQPHFGRPNVSLDRYGTNLEAIAMLAEQHADVVIWVNTTDVSADLDPSVQQFGAPANAQVPYNQVAQRIAREHGFYILDISSEGLKPHDVHFLWYGSRRQGNEVAACVLVALQQEETATCHK